MGCQPPLPELEAQGERVAVGVQADVELCAGTLRAWDHHVSFVETQLGIAPDPTALLDVYVVEDAEPWCQDVMACYIGGWVDATFVPSYEPRAIWHELVHHAVSGSELGMTDRFLSEGMAGAFGDGWCPPPGTDWPEPSILTLLARDDVEYEHYPWAAQFVDFLQQRHGTEALMGLVECIDRGDPLSAVDACVQDVLDTDLEALDAEFREDPPPLHGNPALCGGPAVPWAGTIWTFDAALACEDPAVANTFRSRHGRETAVLVDFDEPGRYAVDLQADGDATLSIEPCFCVQQEDSLWLMPESETVWVGEPGRYRLVFRTADATTSKLRVSLWRLDE